jgi:hypothetical protein
MDRDCVIRIRPLEVGAKEPINGTHEFNCNNVCLELFKLAFNLWVFGEVDEIVDIETKSDRSCGRRHCWIGWINNGALKRHGSNALSLRPRL